MPKRILGSGWQFPIGMDRSDSIALSHHEKKIAESILIILGTAKGERVMRPNFGCDIHDRIFNIVDAATLTLIRSDIEDALILWEPRIEVSDVTTSTERLNLGCIDVEVSYKILYTNTAHNLVYPFYLESEGRQS